MPYQPGQHDKGIKNEIWTCQFLTEVDHYGCEVRHCGGTKVVKDGDTENGDEVSMKKWMGATYDWYNCSPLAREIGLNDLIKPFIEQFKKDIKNVPVDEHKTYRKQQEKELNEFIAESLDKFCTQELADAVLFNFINHSKGLDISITDIKNEKVHIYKFEEHPGVVYAKKGYKPVIISKSGKKKCSRNIFMVKGDDKIDIGLRIRFATNNGLKPFTAEPCSGKKKKNKSTAGVIKFQQDGVDKILEQVKKVCYNDVDVSGVK